MKAAEGQHKQQKYQQQYYNKVVRLRTATCKKEDSKPPPPFQFETPTVVSDNFTFMIHHMVSSSRSLTHQ